LKTQELWSLFKEEGLTFYTGVPDSTFKGWMRFLEQENGKQLTHIIASNECEAVAIATGYYLASGRVGTVYMQNAGEGKIVNPLTSLCDPEVYSIPMLLMIGWRGQPGEKDVPQHWKMGKITLALLEVLEVPYRILTNNSEETATIVKKLLNIANSQHRPVALIIPQKVISDLKTPLPEKLKFPLFREEAMKIVLQHLKGSEAIIATTGYTSSELFEYRVSQNDIPHDFYTVGSMGCSPAIAFGVALQQPSKKVIIFDGDGSLLMQMGSLATIGYYRPPNLYHILFDNEVYDSTGGQPTVSKSISFSQMALACGYKSVDEVSTSEEIIQTILNLLSKEGPVFLTIKVNQGARVDLEHPTRTPIQNKTAFMKHIRL
jgi:phosphonopyruvate decarboxylase